MTWIVEHAETIGLVLLAIPFGLLALLLIATFIIKMHEAWLEDSGYIYSWLIFIVWFAVAFYFIDLGR